MKRNRTTTEVLEDHLNRRLSGDVEADIATNYAEDIIILSGQGVFHGHEGVRASADRLAAVTKGATFHYKRTVIEAEYGLLEWTAEAGEQNICDGVDAFVIRDGKICMQTVHYTVD